MSSCYTSLYSFESLNEEGRADYRTAVIDRAWWDFDAGERGGIDQVKKDVAELIGRLVGDVRLVATGRGFHVHQLFSESVVGHHYRQPLEAYQRRKARGLPTLDGVGFHEKLTRIPGTYNPKRKRWAVVIDAQEFASNYQHFQIPSTPIEKYKDLDPFAGKPVNCGFDFSNWALSYSPEQEDTRHLEAIKLDETTLTAGSVPLMPCLARALNKEQRLAIEDEIFDFIKGLGWKNWNPTLSRKGIKTSMKYRRVPSCAWFAARNMCTGKCWRYDGTVDLDVKDE